jgi:hypothetical protein
VRDPELLERLDKLLPADSFHSRDSSRKVNSLAPRPFIPHPSTFIQ